MDAATAMALKLHRTELNTLRSKVEKLQDAVAEITSKLYLNIQMSAEDVAVIDALISEKQNPEPKEGEQ